MNIIGKGKDILVREFRDTDSRRVDNVMNIWLQGEGSEYDILDIQYNPTTPITSPMGPRTSFDKVLVVFKMPKEPTDDTGILDSNTGLNVFEDQSHTIMEDTVPPAQKLSTFRESTDPISVTHRTFINHDISFIHKGNGHFHIYDTLTGKLTAQYWATTQKWRFQGEDQATVGLHNGIARLEESL